MNSRTVGDTAAGLSFLIEENSPTDDLCPLKMAIRNELQALGMGVSEVSHYLHSGDLKNAEDALGSIFARLTETFCPPNPSQCDWVREGNHGTDCDLLHSHEPLYSLPIPKPTTQSFDTYGPARTGSDPSSVCDQSNLSQKAESTSSLFNDLLDQAMRF